MHSHSFAAHFIWNLPHGGIYSEMRSTVFSESRSSIVRYAKFDINSFMDRNCMCATLIQPRKRCSYVISVVLHVSEHFCSRPFFDPTFEIWPRKGTKGLWGEEVHRLREFIG